MKRILKIVDSVSEWGGQIVRWLSAVLVLVMTTEVVMRYVFNSPTLWAFETAIMLGATVYILGWSYSQLHHKHIRVDVFYIRLPTRGQALIDVLGMLFLAFPILIVMIINSFNYAVIAWTTKERLDLSIWYPPASPLRTIVAFGFILLTMQCLVQFIRDIRTLIWNKPYE
jgi:TRAP-type mannitol/chloroaromatic compound transport system permease small subunit